MSVADRLKAVMERKSLSLKDFAKAAGLPYRTMQNYVNGDREPRVGALADIHTHMGVDLNWLVTGDGAMFRAAGDAVGVAEPSAPRYEADDPGLSRIIGWLRSFWGGAGRAERTWLTVQMERTFPEFRDYDGEEEGYGEMEVDEDLDMEELQLPWDEEEEAPAPAVRGIRRRAG
ncbi:helix-turn-helix domain-containing protein [Endothiovibrio diazotrophicus]